ncbi:hypothetical protein [Curtobacterium aurantiacum]|uniref:hypothetical protein n=1 Tax=Curtobacterium aurantiacum TaxID=3236919 RepID=UPI001BDDF63C|nr:hypothetical protein [Curtobacterium flaccumfaciens]MBT1678682.1 hypothetical protein [Curtobacterium flaccumfaciens pv. flaccumfaciens]
MGNETDRRPLVLVLAGSGYGQQAPLLWWTSEIAAAAGCEVVAPRWQVDDAAGADPVGFVETAVAAALGTGCPTSSSRSRSAASPCRGRSATRCPASG